MTKHQLAAEIGRQLDIKPDDALRMVRILERTIAQALARGDTVHLRGFGIFRVRQRKSARRHRIDLRQTAEMPGGPVPHFAPGNRLRAIVAKGHANNASA